jgi:hypothetical protein
MEVNTFDIFDTLIARRCVVPGRIFQEVEVASGFKGFASIRQQAEVNISASSYTLDDIYKEIIRTYNISENQAKALRELEIEREIQNAIPIQENLKKVRDGDILISDMYLPKDTILQMLRNVGLDRQVGLFVSSHGKISGSVWPKIKSQVEILSHAGDNVKSDLESPSVNNILAYHLNQSKQTNYELFFETNALPVLSRVVRETRLRILHSGLSREKRERLLLQINCNMPILLLGCVHIYLTGLENGIHNFLLCSRDCKAMEWVFRYFLESCKLGVKSQYFLTSRIARISPSASYIRYLNSLCPPGTMIVDLCGTGWSLSQLLDKAENPPWVYLLHHMRNSKVSAQYNEIRAFRDLEKLFSLLTETTLDNGLLELSNYSDSAMFTGMHEIEECGTFIPAFEKPDFSPTVLDILSDFNIARNAFMNTLCNFDASEVFREASSNHGRLGAIIKELYQSIATYLPFIHDLALYHVRQDQKTMWQLSQMKSSP